MSARDECGGVDGGSFPQCAPLTFSFPPTPPPSSPSMPSSSDVGTTSDCEVVGCCTAERDGVLPTEGPPTSSSQERSCCGVGGGDVLQLPPEQLQYSSTFWRKRQRSISCPSPSFANSGRSGTAVASPRPFSFNILERIVAPTEGARDKADGVLWRSDEFTILHDAFPKARLHMLVLPNDTSVKSVSMLRPADQKHCAMLRRMLAVGEAALAAAVASLAATSAAAEGAEGSNEIAVQQQHDVVQVQRTQLGFHARPSLSHLHLHVMTMDFHTGPCMKNKKHYNSFATPFFVPIATVIARLDAGQPALDPLVDYEAILKQPLRCWRCSGCFASMPRLMVHLAAGCSALP